MEAEELRRMLGEILNGVKPSCLLTEIAAVLALAGDEAKEEGHHQGSLDLLLVSTKCVEAAVLAQKGDF